MYYWDKNQEKFCRPDIWSNIDPLKVKHRIDKITHQLDKARRKFEASPADSGSDTPSELTTPFLRRTTETQSSQRKEQEEIKG
ncbi:MAG: hypothetical protein Fur006_38630 [Coleofasciculaceae cyanobacterium]